MIAEASTEVHASRCVEPLEAVEPFPLKRNTLFRGKHSQIFKKSNSSTKLARKQWVQIGKLAELSDDLMLLKRIVRCLMLRCQQVLREKYVLQFINNDFISGIRIPHLRALSPESWISVRLRNF